MVTGIIEKQTVQQVLLTTNSDSSRKEQYMYIQLKTIKNTWRLGIVTHYNALE